MPRLLRVRPRPGCCPSSCLFPSLLLFNVSTHLCLSRKPSNKFWTSGFFPQFFHIFCSVALACSARPSLAPSSPALLRRFVPLVPTHSLLCTKPSSRSRRLHSSAHRLPTASALPSPSRARRKSLHRIVLPPLSTPSGRCRYICAARARALPTPILNLPTRTSALSPFFPPLPALPALLCAVANRAPHANQHKHMKRARAGHNSVARAGRRAEGTSR